MIVCCFFLLRTVGERQRQSRKRRNLCSRKRKAKVMKLHQKERTLNPAKAQKAKTEKRRKKRKKTKRHARKSLRNALKRHQQRKKLQKLSKRPHLAPKRVPQTMSAVAVTAAAMSVRPMGKKVPKLMKRS